MSKFNLSEAVNAISAKIPDHEAELVELLRRQHAATLNMELGDPEAKANLEKLNAQVAAAKEKLANLRGALEQGRQRLEQERQAQLLKDCDSDWEHARALLVEREQVAHKLDVKLLEVAQMMQDITALGNQAHGLASRHLSLEHSITAAPDALGDHLIARLSHLGAFPAHVIETYTTVGWVSAITRSSPLANTVVGHNERMLKFAPQTPINQRAA